MKVILLPVVATLALAGGCVTHGDIGGGYSYGYAAPAPSLYYVSPGVQVVAYSDYPVFYSDNYYWRYDGGLWYRSSYYGGGWVVWNDVPYSVRSIDRPHRYARYTPGQGWSSGGAYNGGVRDHRTYSPPPARGYQGPAARGYSGGPAVRDHRTNAPPAYSPPPAAGRDHRSAPPPAYSPAPAAAPAARDHRSAPPPASAPAAPSRPAPAPARDHRR